MKLSQTITEYIEKARTGGSIIDGEYTFTIKRAMRPTSVMTYTQILTKFLNTVGNMEISQIGTKECAKFLNLYSADSSAGDILNIFFRAQIALNRYNKYGLDTPTKMIKKSSTSGGVKQKSDIPYLRQEDLIKLMKKSQSIYNIAIGNQAIHGFRIAEFAGNINRGGDIPGLSILDMSELLQEGKLYILGKRAKNRWICTVKVILGDYYDKFEEIQYGYFKDRKKKVENSLLYWDMQYSQYNTYLDLQRQSLGIKVFGIISDAPMKTKLTTQILRHTFGTLYVENGGNPLTLQELMGHESYDTTQIYARITVKSREREILRLEKEHKELIRGKNEMRQL